ncbi:hypothetical protein [Microbulbifer variabilis]|uniref:hypothetical protein n=1 Tax=Microbulbifer variabilis TaxID=266805 RepID=UPI001CFCCF4F|nr:hypothetical protein [Microbulbifer variabilis]
MAKLYLHVGMPKTGTSYIQAYMNLNVKRLKADHDVEVVSGRDPHILACEHIKDARLQKREDIKGLLQEKKLADISQRLSKFSSGSVVICSSEYFTLSDKKSVLNYFFSFFDDVEVIYTVRRQDKLLASGFNQDVKALGRTSNLVWSKNDKLLDYHSNCKEWRNLGAEVSIINFDQVRKSKQNLEKVFLKLCGVGGDLSGYTIPDSVGANYSLKRREVLLKLALNRRGVEMPEVMEKFINFNNQDVEFALPKYYERVMMSYYSDSNKKFAEEFCGDSDMTEFFALSATTNSVDKFEWNPIGDSELIINFLIDFVVGQEFGKNE